MSRIGLFSLKKAATFGVAMAAMIAAGPASALDFNFSFSSDLGDPATGNAVAGTVYGRILGLTDNATSAATSVFIDGYSVSGFGSFPTDAVTWNIQDANAFTVVGGVLTTGLFHADNTTNGLDRLYINYPVGWPKGNTNYASTGVNNRISIWNNTGVSVFNPAVPEPASWAMMIGGFALAGAAMRRRKAAVSFA